MKFRDAWFSEKPEYWWILMARKGNVSQKWFNSSSEFVWICPNSINRLLSESLFASTISWVAPVCHELPLYRLPEQVIVSAIWMFSPLVLGSLGSTLAQVIFLDDFAHLHFKGLKTWIFSRLELGSSHMPPRFSQRFWPTSSKPLTTMLDLHLPWGTVQEHFFDSTGALQWHEKIRFFLGTSDFLGYFLTVVHCVPTSGSAYLLACLFLSIIKPHHNPHFSRK